MVTAAAICYAMPSRADDLAGPMLLAPHVRQPIPLQQPADQHALPSQGLSVAMMPQESAEDESPQQRIRADFGGVCVR